MTINNNKTDLLQLESSRAQVLKTLSSKSSFPQKLIYLFKYFDKILCINDKNLNEVYISELIFEYLKVIKHFDAFGVEPKFTISIINQLKTLKELNFLEAENKIISDEIKRISIQLNELQSSLNGISIEENKASKGFFILVEKSETEFIYGIIETISIKINQTHNRNNIIIIPSDNEIDEKLYSQCERSWNLALEITKKYVKKLNKYHEIIIIFEKKIGIYEGISLGLVLTLVFVQELLKYYNPSYQITIKSNCAFSGGITENEEILRIGETIIKRKIKTVFYSDIAKFIIPKRDELIAQKTLEELKKTYPKRNLKIISVENFSDIFNRRDLIDFKRINPIIRASKFIKNNFVTFLSIIILSTVLSLVFVLDLDNNPETIFFDGEKAYIKNKNGKTLFYIDYLVDNEFLNNPKAKFNLFKIVDINGDNINEIIYVDEFYNVKTRTQKISSIRCVNNKNELMWVYHFLDTVYSAREILPPEYSFKLIDTISVEGKVILIFWVNNGPSFSTAISGLDVRTGKRIQQTFWGSGHTINAELHDLNNDGIRDILACGLDNGFEDAVVWGSEVKKLEGYRPTTPEYTIIGKKEAEMIFYLRVPKQDIDIYYKTRMPSIRYNLLYYKEINKTIYVGLLTNSNPNLFNVSNNIPTFNIAIDSNFVVSDVIILSNFRVLRDSLIAKGQLYPPYTDTKEYKEIIKNSILYWKDGKWVKRNK